MKVVLIGPYKPTIGGVVTHLFNLHQRLLKERQDVKVIDVTSKDKSERTTRDVYRVRQNPMRLLWGVINLRFKGYDLFHFHVSKKGIYILLLIPFLKLSGAKYLVTFHSGDIYQWFLNAGFINRFAIKIVYWLSSKIMFVNKNTCDQFRKTFNWSKIDYYASFILKHGQVDDVERTYYNNNVLNIVTTGLWQNYYRYEDVIELAKWAAKSGTNIKLTLMVGTYAANSEYKKLIEHKIEEATSVTELNIKLLEDYTEPLNLFKSQDVLIRSSEVDSYGLTIAEALSMGTFCIATNVCQRPGGCITYESGNIDELRECFNEVSEKIKSGQASQDHVELDDGFERLYNIYKAVS